MGRVILWMKSTCATTPRAYDSNGAGSGVPALEARGHTGRYAPICLHPTHYVQRLTTSSPTMTNAIMGSDRRKIFVM